MKTTTLAALLLLSTTAALAAPLSCPDLSTAVQVAVCPAEVELKITYRSYCSDDARMKDKPEDMMDCVSYENYLKKKNVALWESADGAFQGYVHCDLPAEKVKASKAVKVGVSKVGKVTRVACAYEDGIVFTHRTKAACKVEGDGRCAGAPAEACKASCD